MHQPTAGGSWAEHSEHHFNIFIVLQSQVITKYESETQSRQILNISNIFIAGETEIFIKLIHPTLERGHKPFFLQTIISQTIFAQFFQFLNQQASQTN